MLRVAEAALLLGPLVVALLWLRVSRSGGPSRRVVAAAGCGLLLLVAALVWLSQRDRIGRYESYVPARVVDGQVVPGHAVR